VRPDAPDAGSPAVRGVSDAASSKAPSATPDENPGGPH
jgi:hypothetical protein